MSEDASTMQVAQDQNGPNSMDFLALLAIPGVAILYCLLSFFMKQIMAEIRLHGMFVKQGWVVVWRPSAKIDIENPRLPELAANKRMDYDPSGKYATKGNFKGRKAKDDAAVRADAVKKDNARTSGVDDSDPVVKAMQRVTLARATEMREIARAEAIEKQKQAVLRAEKAREQGMGQELKDLLNPTRLNLWVAGSGQVQSLTEEKEMEAWRKAHRSSQRGKVGRVTPLSSERGGSQPAGSREISRQGSVHSGGSKGGGGAHEVGRGGLNGEERIVGADLNAVVGLRVILRRPLDGRETPEEYEERVSRKGTIVWVDETDLDGDGRTGDLAAVVWDEAGERDVYKTGLEGGCDLAASVGPDIPEGYLKGLRGAVALLPVKRPWWRGMGIMNGGELIEARRPPLDHEVVILDRWGGRNLKSGEEDDNAGAAEEKNHNLHLAKIEAAREAGMLDPRKRLAPLKRKGLDDMAVVRDDEIVPIGKVVVRLLYAEKLPVKPVPGGGPRSVYAVALVRGKQILASETTTNECNPEWGERARGIGSVWEAHDTIQVIVLEKVKNRKDKQVGACRLYLEDVRGKQSKVRIPRGDTREAMSHDLHLKALATVEGVCEECNGTGVDVTDHDHDDDEAQVTPCMECDGSGTCFEKWLRLEPRHSGGHVRVRVKFVLPRTKKVPQKWNEVRGTDLLPQQYENVSYHDNAAAVEWKRLIQVNKASLMALAEDDKHPLEKLQKVVGRAKKLGSYHRDSEGAFLEPITKGMDQEIQGIAKEADMRLKVLEDAEHRMGPCAQGLRMAMSRWGSLVTIPQKKALVIEMSSRFSRLMQTAAELNMHHHKKYKTVVAQAQKMCEDVDSVLDIVVQLKARGVIVQQNNPDPTGFTPREEGWEQNGLEKMGKARMQGDKAAGKYG